MKSIAFFNNKGGVGKTTLACNVASFFATLLGKRVLLVDCDPQCNSTQLVMSEETCDSIYDPSDSTSTHSTILDILAPIRDGDSNINHTTVPVLGSTNRFNIDVVPGHPSMSIIEDKLGEAWSKLAAGDTGGFRITNWCAAYLDSISPRYDLVIFDLGPSLGPINRSVLLGVDFFVTPMGCDIFSIVGVRNIGNWCSHWIELYRRHYQYFSETNQAASNRYKIRPDIRIATGFAGYTVLQYITKSIKGERRATGAFETILARVPDEIRTNLGRLYANGVDDTSARLGDVPNMFSLVPLAQSVRAPIMALESRDGLAGGQFKQQEAYSTFIETVGRALATNIKMEATV